MKIYINSGDVQENGTLVGGRTSQNPKTPKPQNPKTPKTTNRNVFKQIII